MLKRTSADLYFDALSGASTIKKRKVQATSDSLVSKLGLKDLTPDMISGLWNLPAIPADDPGRSSADGSAQIDPEAAEGYAFNASRLEEYAVKSHRASYSSWSTTLTEGHPMLFHGVGTAEPVLEDYVQRVARAGRGCYVIIRGYMPGLRIEKVLQAIESATTASEVDLWEGTADPWMEQSSRGRIWQRQQGRPKVEAAAAERKGAARRESSVVEDEDEDDEDDTEHSSFLETRAHNLRKKYSYAGELPPVYLVLVSIDRPALLSARAQQVLSILAQAHRIYLLASANHINAGLLLGLNGVGAGSNAGADGPGQPSSKINWLWQDLNTYVPPINEMLVTSGKKVISLPRAFSLNLHSHAGRAATDGGPGSGGGVAPGVSNQEPLKSDYPAARAIRVLQSLGVRHLKFFKEVAMLQLRIPPGTDFSSVDQSSIAEQSPVLFSAALERAQKEYLGNDIDGMKALLHEPISHGMMRVVKWSDAQEDLKKLRQGQEYFWINMSKEAVLEVLQWLLQELDRTRTGQQTAQATRN